MKNFLIGEVKALEDDSPNGAFEVILSAPTLDRDGEVIDAKAFDPLPDHITFDVDHGMSVSSTIGSGVPFYEGDLLKVRGTYSSRPMAQEVRGLVKEQHIRTTSVAFMNPKREVKDGVPHIVKAELLNGAFVAIPSNRDALVVAAKAHRPDSDNRKAIAGSYEQRSELIREALREAHPDAYWVWIRATFDDHIVYEVATPGSSDETFRATYEIADDGIVTLGSPEPVEVTEVVSPKSVKNDPETAAAAAAAAPVRAARHLAALAEAEVVLATT